MHMALTQRIGGASADSLRHTVEVWKLAGHAGVLDSISFIS